MSWILGPAGRAQLRRLSAARGLVALDFDGTLAPIVRDRHAARPRPRTLALLQRVAASYPTLVLTGRGRADVLARLPGVPLAEVVGNHGAERIRADPKARRWRRLVRGWAGALARVARGLPGVEVEDTGLSVAAHYRGAADPALAGRRLEEAARKLAGAVMVCGKRVVSVLPVDAPHKGSALAAVAHRLGARRVLFVGDDDTDEDAFGHDLGVPATMVRVGLRKGSRAAFHLRSQAELDGLLGALLALREKGRAARPVGRGARGPGG